MKGLESEGGNMDMWVEWSTTSASTLHTLQLAAKLVTERRKFQLGVCEVH